MVQRMGADALVFITLKAGTGNLGESILTVAKYLGLSGEGVLGERRLKRGIRHRMLLEG